jgi:sugar (pentulose or hexulose) kinase/phosphoglycerate dehydrogenase-like enzyme/ribulose-5-phosphate 4-epimerase/fuculose-1-phosphate aldolase/putative sterol carrier protein
MSPNYLMGLDVGGGGGRCLLVDVASGVLTTTFRPWTHPPAPDTGGWGFDLHVDRVWRALGETAREALNQAQASPAQVLGVAATSMRHGMVLLDADGRERLAVPNRDARAASQGLELARERGALFYQRTGHWPSPVFAAARLLWLRERAPHSLKQARALLSLSDWAAFRLTGALAAEPSQAAETLLFDVQSCTWADDLIASLNLPRNIFPTLRDAGTRLGSLTAAAAAHLGLTPGLPVAVGGADTQSGLLGAGAVAAGQLAVIAGTTTPIQLVIDHPVIDPQRRLWTGRHVVPGLWVLESNAGGMGKALDWFARLLYPDAPDAVALLTAEATASLPGACGMTSTLGVTIFNASQMGLPVDSLTMTHEIATGDNGRQDRAHLARAILEGLAYSVRANAAQVTQVAGIDPSTLHLSGGMSRSSFWSQLLSDVMNTPVEVSATPEASALGAAICAGVGAGLYKDLAAGAQALSRVVRRHAPQAENVQGYQSLFADWNEAREARADADLGTSSRLVEVLIAKNTSQSPMTLTPASRPRILATADIDATALDALQDLGDVEYASYRQEMRLLAGEELVEALQGVSVFITEVDVVDADALAQLPDLRLIAVCRGAPVNVDLTACTAFGVPVIHTPGRNADAVADLTLAYMLMLARKLPAATAFLRQPGGEAGDMGRLGIAHSQLQGHELWGKTVGLVGLGAVGRKTAQRLIPFGVRVLVYDPYVTPEQAILSGTAKVSLDTLLLESDFVSLHAPASQETRGMIDAQALARMKRGACLINTARAALIQTDALLEALQSGHLGGAALDVFPVEPPGADDPLLALPNVITTPHVGGNTHQVATHQGQIVVQELRRLLHGQRPRHVCNPATLDNFSWTGPRAAPSATAVEQLVAGPGPAVSDLQVEAKAAQAAQAPPTSPAEAEAGRATAPQPATTTQPQEKTAGLRSILRKMISGKQEPTPPATSPSPAGATRAHMAHILQAFVHKVSADAALRDFSKGKQVIMHFSVTDLDLSFYFSFQDGTVTSALGAPPVQTDVTLKMNADTLDGIFTGRISGTRAAFSGKLSFKGDTAKAMAFQRIQNSLSQLYSAAREEMGDPGDLTHIGVPAAAPQTLQEADRAPIEAATIAAQGAPPAGRTGDVRDEILEVVNELYARGLITATGGNVSARVEGQENQLWITPSQLFKGNLRPDIMMRIDLDGHTLDAHPLAPSSEWRVHAAIYRARPDVHAVIHSHAPQTTILGMTGKPFLPISTEAAFIGEIPRVPFGMPGTHELAAAVAQAMGQGIAVIMQNHGLVVAGSSLRRAADVTEIIETSAEKILTCYMLGQEPPVLPDTVVATLREIGEMLV